MSWISICYVLDPVRVKLKLSEHIWIVNSGTGSLSKAYYTFHSPVTSVSIHTHHRTTAVSLQEAVPEITKVNQVFYVDLYILPW